MIKIIPIPCEHIAAFYAERWKGQHCIGFKLLWQGYTQCAEGIIEAGFNNLFTRPTLVMP